MNVLRTVVLVPDVRNWAFDNIAQYLKYILQDRYNVQIIYSGDFVHPGKLIDKLDNLGKIDYIHFFYRGYLKNLLEYIATHNIKDKKLIKFLKIATTTSIPDHLFINNQKDILEYQPAFSFVDNYYTTSTKLHNIYNDINVYPSPWKKVIFDNILIEPLQPNFSNNEKLVVTWIGNSAWGEWYFAKGYDPKGYHSVIIPTLSKIKSRTNIEICIADGKEKKRSKKEILNLLQKTDILLIAATTDGTPLPLIEAMASGCAIISTNNGIAPEVLPKIQQQFILHKNPDEFIAAIEELDNNRALLTELKHQNFIAYQQCFTDNAKFTDLWSSLIEESIERCIKEKREVTKKQGLKIIKSESLFNPDILVANTNIKPIVKYLLRYNFFKVPAKYLYFTLKTFTSKNIFRNNTQNYLKHLRQNLERYNLLQNNDGIYAIYPPMFPGVANSTKSLFTKSIPLPIFGSFEHIGLPDTIITEIAKIILEFPVKKLIMSGSSQIIFQLTNKLYVLKRNKKLDIYCLWHGSSAQWSDEHHLQHFCEILDLYKHNKFAAIITLKKDLEVVLESMNIKSYLLQNFIQRQNTFLRSLKTDTKIRIGLWSAYAIWIKNLYPQILAVSMMSNQVNLHTNFHFSRYDNWITNSLTLKTLPVSLAHAELINEMANTDITLYITNTECSPMIALESLGLGIPCLVGPTSALYDADEFLKEILTVNRVDCPVAIKNAIERVIDNYQAIQLKLPHFIDEYNKNAKFLKSQLEKTMLNNTVE